MDIIIYIGSVLAGFLLSLFWKPAYKVVNQVGKLYLGLALLLAISVWVFYFAGIKNATVLNVMSLELHAGGIIAHVILGLLLSRLAIGLKSTPADPGILREILSTTLWALSISFGNSYILSTVGKYTFLQEMITFFSQSGYAIWFLYFIMAAESIGAIGVLLHFKLRTGIPATAGLVLIMLGAVYTHWHNHDPFSDSYAAVNEIISALLLLFLYSLERKLKRQIPVQQPVNQRP